MAATVKQLREKLSEFPDDAVVLLRTEGVELDPDYFVHISVGLALNNLHDLVVISPTAPRGGTRISLSAIKDGWRPLERSDA